MSDAYIQTLTGKLVRPLVPGGIEFDIEDIAGSLSKKCRFSGHCKWFYSVAEHSLHVSRLVPEEHAFWGLMHDAHEAYTSDLSTQLKRAAFFEPSGTVTEISDRMTSWKEMEQRIQGEICDWLGLFPVQPLIVEIVDARMLATEKHYLMEKPDEPERWGELPEPYSEIEIPELLNMGDCFAVKSRFLTLFEELQSKRMEAV